jgi:hypothetical protein
MTAYQNPNGGYHVKTGKTLQELAQEIERQAKTKRDYVAGTGLVKVEPIEKGLAVTIGDKGTFPVSPIAHDQIAEHTGIPKKYYDKCRETDPELLATNVDRWFKRFPAPRLWRTLDSKNRAFLSDKFQCFDNHDFANAALPVLLRRKLNVVSCEVTEKRLYIKAIDEALFRDVPVGHKMGDGSHQIFDTCAPVVILANSEVGFGRYTIDTGVYTRACTNLALFSKGGLKRTHIGARNKLAEGVDVANLEDILSDEAKRKTLEALFLQSRDVINAAFDPGVIGKRLEQLAATSGVKITGKVEKVVEVTRERFGLTEVEGESVLKFLIEGGSLTQYGLHAAVTRSAQDAESYDRATELEYAGGAIVELKPHEFERLAEAA